MNTRITAVCYISIFGRIRKITLTIPDSHGKPVCCALILHASRSLLGMIILVQNRKTQGWDGQSFKLLYPMNDVSAISFAITDEHVHNAKAGKELLKFVKDRIKRIFADKSYDSKAIYNAFGENTIIPPRKNSSSKISGSHSLGKNSQTDPKEIRKEMEGMR